MLADELQNEDESHYLLAQGGDCDCDCDDDDRLRMPDPIAVAGVRG